MHKKTKVCVHTSYLHIKKECYFTQNSHVYIHTLYLYIKKCVYQHKNSIFYKGLDFKEKFSSLQNDNGTLCCKGAFDWYSHQMRGFGST